MPSGRSILVPLLVIVAVTALAACGAGSESIEGAAPEDPRDGAITTPGDVPVEGGAAASDAALVAPTGGKVQGTIDRDGDHTTLFVGDSVLVSVADDLAARVDGDLVFDAADCRRLAETVYGSCGGVPAGVEIADGLTTIAEVMDDLVAEGNVPEVVVLVLANNSTIEDHQIDAAMDLLAEVPQVWWVNARIDGFGRQDFNNLTLGDLDSQHDRFGVIDWFGASDDPAWFRDHVHPNDLGQANFADLIADHLACGCVP